MRWWGGIRDGRFWTGERILSVEEMGRDMALSRYRVE